MVKILIIDDESITRQWIKKKVEDISADYSVVGLFSNGRQAFEYCKKESVDVIFTDIRMSTMDGMEFLKNILRLDMHPYKVILSAYDEFQYAREAIKLGVHEFLLKPEITQSELKRILKDAQSYLATERSDSAQGVFQSEKQREILRSLMDKNAVMTEEEISGLLLSNKIMLEAKNLTAMSIYFETGKNIEKSKDLFEIFLEEKHICWYFYQSDSQEFMILYNHRNEWTRRNLAEELFHILQVHLGMKLYIGISARKDGLSKLNSLCRQASLAKDNRRFFDIPGCQLYDEMRVNKEDNEEELYFSDAIKELSELLDKEKCSEAEEKSGELLEQIGHADFLPPTYVKALCNELLIVFMHRLWRQELEEEEKKAIGSIELLLGENIHTFYELNQRMQKARKYLCDVFQKKCVMNRYSSQIRDVVNYIEHHYQERIVMEDIANSVHLSRTYLSVLFKKETGERFSDYLQRIRLENSCRLLRTTKLQINEIAERTGFFDAAHFSRVFKERYEMSPLEYRKLE